MKSTLYHVSKCAVALASILIVGSLSAPAVSFSLPSTTTSASKLDLGLYGGGTLLSLQMSGTIKLISSSDYDTFANGSMVHLTTDPTVLFANPGAAYPTLYGGDGLNHFPGGGCNYDVALGGAGAFGPAGAMTTDTTDPGALRFGSVIGTFSPSPGRSDWFLIGLADTVVVPQAGAHLYVAVHDSNYGNNVGSYSGSLLVVPEPSALALVGLGAGSLLALGSARRGRLATKAD
jgi:hypothetical protein